MTKLFLIVLFLIGGALASPRKYHYVSTEQFETPDNHMHPNDNPSRSAGIKPKAFNEAELTKEYWIQHGKDFIESRLKLTPNTKKARNIIMFLGDGLSHTTVAATRMLLGGEEKMLSFEKFPYTASSVTYCTDVQVADSACTATAYLGGVKTNDGVIGMNARALFENCNDSNMPDKFVSPISEWAMDAGKWAGTVTTTRITHASPAGTYAHTTTRDWEDDFNVRRYGGCDPEENDDIAEQLVHGHIGKRLKVALGGGIRHFINATENEHGSRGFRNDGKNLINEWLADKPTRSFVRNKPELMNVDPKNVDQLIGLFSTAHMPYRMETVRDNLTHLVPSLAEMTSKAIDILDENPEGYFLFVEGGRIDHAHHDTWARLSLDETKEFSEAIQAAIDKVNLDETLIVVTADHSHSFTYAGYQYRGEDIFNHYGNAQDGMPYMVLSYANGQGYAVNRNDTHGRFDPRDLTEARESMYYRFPATAPRDSETHGGDDVGIWAIGPWSHLFTKTIEQNAIPHYMGFAACVGNGRKMCDSNLS